MQNDLFTVQLNPEDGTVSSLVLNRDPAKMNWVEGFFHWGKPALSRFGAHETANWGGAKDFEFTGMQCDGNTSRAHYRKETLELEVTRTLKAGRLTERYTYRNTGYYDLFFQRGDLGIYTTFNDSYPASDICLTRRCDAHIWCGGAHSYIHAKKMGPFPMEMALILTRGELDSYSVERLEEEASNDRGDFILHPAPCHLRHGEKLVIEWELAAFPAGSFREALLSTPGGLHIGFDQETVFLGEKFTLTLETHCLPDDLAVTCRGRDVPWRLQDGRLTAEYAPDEPGEYRFDFRLGERRLFVRGYCSLPFETLLERRVRFLLRHQFRRDPSSPLHGAFLIYDNEEHSQYYDYVWRDHNTSGERGNMGLLICRWAQMHPEDREAREAVDLYEQYILRETYETDTGIVHGDVGKHSCRVRLYNTAMLINLWIELYRLKGNPVYLEWIARSIRLFYSAGGTSFYPNGTLFSDAIVLIRQAGLTDVADELTALVRKHVEKMMDIGMCYPPHETHFEQTIATPAVAIPAAFCDLTGPAPEILRHCAGQIDVLERFSGDQPDYRLNEIPIRHWDEFWFGKRHLFGDTFPHYLSALTARAFMLYSRISNLSLYREKAKKCLRNCLCLFFADGSASCAYLYPLSVTMRKKDGTVYTPARRGEFFDPYANDQDGMLYLTLQLGGSKALQ